MAGVMSSRLSTSDPDIPNAIDVSIDHKAPRRTVIDLCTTYILLHTSTSATCLGRVGLLHKFNVYIFRLLSLMKQVLAEGVVTERQHHSSCLALDFLSSSLYNFLGLKDWKE
jgi:hypothetical protein